MCHFLTFACSIHLGTTYLKKDIVKFQKFTLQTNYPIKVTVIVQLTFPLFNNKVLIVQLNEKKL